MIAGLLMMRLAPPRRAGATASSLENVLEEFRYARRSMTARGIAGDEDGDN